MRPSPIAIALITFTLAACQPQPVPAPAATEASDATATAAVDSRFADLSKRWLDGWLQLAPVAATQIGDHRFDERARRSQRRRPRRSRSSSARRCWPNSTRSTSAKLSRENQVDAAILRNQLPLRRLEHRNAAELGLGSAGLQPAWPAARCTTLMAREFAPLPRAPALRHRAHGEDSGPAGTDAREPRSGARAEDPCRNRAEAEQRACSSIVDSFITPHLKELRTAERKRAETPRSPTLTQGRGRAPGLAGQDAGAECQGRLPHRPEAVRREARLRAAIVAVARRHPHARRGRTQARARRDVRHRPHACSRSSRAAATRPRNARRAQPDEASSRRRSRPRWSWPTPTDRRATRWSKLAEPGDRDGHRRSCARRTSSPCPTRRSRSS